MGLDFKNIYLDQYTPVGDQTVLAVCLVIIVLLIFSYVSRTRSYMVFCVIVGFLIAASISDIMYHTLALQGNKDLYGYAILLRFLFHLFLFTILFLYVLYITEVQRLEMNVKVPTLIVSGIIWLVVVFLDGFQSFRENGLQIEDGTFISRNAGVFAIGYVAFVTIISILMIAFRKRLYIRVMFGFYGTMLVSFTVLYLQGINGRSSFTASTFLFPLIAMLYIMHSTPYNVELGAIDKSAFEDMIRYNYSRKCELLIMSLCLLEFDEEGKTIPRNLQSTIRRYASEFFNGAVLFQISNGHVVLVSKKSRNMDYENRINKMLNGFADEYQKFQLDYKIIIGESIEEISRKNEYISFMNSIHRNMPVNTVHMVGYEDVVKFNEYEYIMNELEDIARVKNTRDPRVLAYCQPVFNIKTQKYDTAEALMRLKLNDIGMVFPDKFIPLAEENGYIHVLTEIILQKTCDEIKYLLSEGYEVKRISVNVSVLELRDNNFCDDLSNIIEKSGIPSGKVAIELTETQSESDFIYMKEKINQLKEKGIKFYLDDFGTGYSNMERIMELPFDIIKFDRSLVMASDGNERSEKMVGGLANMFKELNYSVLYEGVENDTDEERCINMSASYLQGYKYSKPVPIIELKRFFSKSVSE